MKGAFQPGYDSWRLIAPVPEEAFSKILIPFSIKT
jgi:inactivated superfamily I helicase